MPLHNTVYNAFNRRNHLAIDGTVNDEVFENLARIKIYPMVIESEDGLAEEIARIATLSMVLGYRLEEEGRLLTLDEAYRQLGHSASLFQAILGYVRKETDFQ
jgi:hypothetical protein